MEWVVEHPGIPYIVFSIMSLLFELVWAYKASNVYPFV